jgi:hypothetical protein
MTVTAGGIKIGNGNASVSAGGYTASAGKDGISVQNSSGGGVGTGGIPKTPRGYWDSSGADDVWRQMPDPLRNRGPLSSSGGSIRVPNMGPRPSPNWPPRQIPPAIVNIGTPVPKPNFPGVSSISGPAVIPNVLPKLGPLDVRPPKNIVPAIALPKNPLPKEIVDSVVEVVSIPGSVLEWVRRKPLGEDAAKNKRHQQEAKKEAEARARAEDEQSERRRLLQAEYSPDQSRIIDELFHQGQLSPQSLAEFQDAFATVYGELFAQWWDRYGQFGREPTQQDLDSMFETASQEAQRRWLLSHGLNPDGSRVVGTGLDSADEDGGKIFVPSPKPSPKPGPRPDPTPESPDRDHSSPPSSRTPAEIRRDFRNQIRKELAPRLDRALAGTKAAARAVFSDNAISLAKSLVPSAETIRQWTIDQAKGKAVDWAETLVPGVGIATEATGVVIDFVTKYREETAKPALTRNPTSHLLGSPQDMTVKNFISSATTDERAREVGRNKTVWQDAAGNWYVDNNPNFQPNSPYQQVWHPRPELVGPNGFGADPKAHQLDIARGNATPQDRPAVSAPQVLGNVIRDYAKNKFIEKAKEKLKEQVFGPRKP